MKEEQGESSVGNVARLVTDINDTTEGPQPNDICSVTSTTKEIEEDNNNDKDDDDEEEEEETEDEDDDNDNDNYEEEEEEEDDDEEPPKLKYTRFTQLPSAFLTKDAISACLFHESVVVFATHSGFVHLMKPDLKTLIRTFRAHRASVLSIHTDGEYIATGSMDGTVVIGSIFNEPDIFAVDFKRPIHAVVFDGQYANSKSFITGGTSGKVILSTKNWLGQRVDTVLEDTNSTILELKVFGDLVIWMNDSGLNFYQLSSRTKLYDINLPHSFPRPDLYWPKVDISGSSLIVGWANTIWSIKLIEMNNYSDSRSILSTRSVSSLEKKIHIDKQIQLKDTLIAGISSFYDNFLVLNYVLPLSGGKSSQQQPPELKIISGITLEDLSVDEVELKNFASLGVNDYKLKRCNLDNKWALVGANEVIIVEEFNLNDQLDWFLERDNYLNAWDISKNLMSVEQRCNEIASKQLQNYIDNNEWQFCAQFLVKVVDEIEDGTFSKEFWEFWVSKFQEASRYDELVDEIPTTKVTLESIYYSKFILHYLDINKEKAVELIKRWDHNLFDIDKVNNSIGTLLTDYDQGDTDGLSGNLVLELRNIHIELSVELHQYSHAAIHLFKSKDKSILNFLSDNHLLRDFFDDIPKLITIDLTKDELKYYSIDSLRDKLMDRVEILIENRHELIPSEMIKLLQKNDLDVVSFFYLQRLFEAPGFITTNFEDEMVRLYSEYDPSQLLGFLQKYKNYNIETAISICKTKKSVKELVFLYSRIGQNKMALELIINELNDPEYAINFTLSLKDSDLFEHLVDYSSDKPEFIKLLIVEAGNNNIDLEKIITRVPTGVEIENLQKTLISITSNNKGEAFIHAKILKIIEDETMSLLYEMRDQKLRGEVFDPVALRKLLDGETIIKYASADEQIYKESEFIGVSNMWSHAALTISDKIRHFIYIKTKAKSLKDQEL